MNIHPPEEPYPDKNPFIEKQGLLDNNDVYIEKLPSNTKKRVVFCLTFVILIIVLIMLAIFKQNK